MKRIVGVRLASVDEFFRRAERMTDAALRWEKQHVRLVQLAIADKRPEYRKDPAPCRRGSRVTGDRCRSQRP